MTKLHLRNKHINGYDFSSLCKHLPALSAFVINSVNGDLSIDFSDPIAVKTLNQALLKSHYNIEFWDLPEQFLCPPVPGRADYIHYLADLLAADNQGQVPTGKQIKVLDIGTGANLIYPLIGTSEYGWQFTGSDIDVTSIKLAKQIVQFNRLNIKLRHQKDTNHIFTGIISDKDLFHITLCNPPFHASEADAQKGTQRKWQNLGKQSKDKQLKGKQPKATLNFGGRQNELWCEGGEQAFIHKMIVESQLFSDQCIWFTSLVSKKDSLPPLKALLKTLPVAEVKIVKMAQGQKVSRFIAWSYFDADTRQEIMKS